jgi:flagellar hook-associated protein 1 FlgK
VIQKGILSGVIPETIAGEGFEITIETGLTRENDRFLIQPTRYGGRDIDLELERPDRLAIASAINANSSLGNEGGGKIVSTEALDVTTPSFEVPGELSPPLVIVFTSQTTYDVLDNSNPARPIDLIPPMKGLSYTPGIQNKMLPDNPAQTIVTSDGLLAGRLPNSFVLTPDEVSTNGYPAEVLTITTRNPVTGIVSIQPNVNVVAGESAGSVARNLTALTGVVANARTQVFLSGFINADGGTQPMTLSVNGIQVNMPLDLNELTLLSPNYLADLITANPEFQALGISAKSDGATLILETAGDDLNIAIRGDSEDQFTLRDVTGRELIMTGAGGSTTAELSGDTDRSAGYDFSTGGPYRFSLSVNGSTTEEIFLTGNQVLGSDVVKEIQQKIDASNISAGDVIVSMSVTGRISLTTRETGTSANIEIIDVSPATNFALGFVPGSDSGAEVQHEVTVGGIIHVVMEDGVSLGSNAIAVDGNLFQSEPESLSTFLGFQVTIDGIAEAGDKFEINYNGSGVSDNRNGIALTAIETNKLLDHSTVSLLESYGRLVEFVGAKTSQSIINAEASESLLHQSQLTRDGISGVNLDEEAADLIRYELAYNASAQVISVARSLFDTLINTFR